MRQIFCLHKICPTLFLSTYCEVVKRILFYFIMCILGDRGAIQICGIGGNGGKGSRVMWKEYGGRGLGLRCLGTVWLGKGKGKGKV